MTPQGKAMSSSTASPRIIAAAVLAGTLSILDLTIVVPILTAVGRDFGAGSEVSWLVAAYMVASTATIPPWGRAMDLRGERTAVLAYSRHHHGNPGTKPHLSPCRAGYWGRRGGPARTGGIGSPMR